MAICLVPGYFEMLSLDCRNVVLGTANERSRVCMCQVDIFLGGGVVVSEPAVWAGTLQILVVPTGGSLYAVALDPMRITLLGKA